MDDQNVQNMEAAGKVPASPKARRLARERGVDLAGLYRGRPLVSADIPEGRPAVRATPLAKRIAQIRGLSLESVTGSGRLGKIFSRDLPGAAAESGGEASGAAEGTLVPLRGMRRTIARRMLESHEQIPPVTLNARADVTFLSEFRRHLNEAVDTRISYNDLVVAASAKALADFPDVNATYTDEGVLLHKQINVGIAVAVENGLVVPVVRDADSLRLTELAKTAKELADSARAGRLKPDQYAGGTFTVTNLGMFGITSFTPIINLPEAAILGVCTIEKQLALQNGSVVEKEYMGLSLTFDHRCIDGAQGARFLGRIRGILENPLELL